MDIQTTFQPNGEWDAIDANTYDVDCDADGFFSPSPRGWGKTREEAIADLLDQIAERKSKEWNDGQPSEVQEWADYDRDC